MVTERFDFGVPVVTDQVDGSTLYVLGVRWTASVDGSWTGNSWLRVPDSVGAANHYMLAYDSVSHVHLATAAFTPAVGTLQNVNWTTPLAVTAGTEYIACVLTDHYVYRASYVFPETDSRLTATGSRLVLGTADTERYPTDATTTNFYVSPNVLFAEPVTIALGRITESDTMRALAAAKAPALGRVTETDSAQALALAKTATLGRVSESDTARALGLTKSVALGRVTETTAARALAVTKTIALGRITVTTAMRGLVVAQPGLADMDVVVGPPHTSWHIGSPQTSWHVGPIRT